ncbi:MAG: hypothetical protein LBI96_05245 [Odoribacteraceae bacterium]|nr:hypothetical protein [Odoribacteraceae bacterium]
MAFLLAGGRWQAFGNPADPPLAVGKLSGIPTTCRRPSASFRESRRPAAGRRQAFGNPDDLPLTVGKVSGIPTTCR